LFAKISGKKKIKKKLGGGKGTVKVLKSQSFQ